ncbi:MAG: leucine-rich repeat protein, partial [Oscillospiraceae bacterium]|nr:leucine-rich repeat protein [Oscillospiraceae bacterium]
YCGVAGVVTIPDGVTKIGVDAFKGCTGLTSIAIPDSVTKIGRRAFHNCAGLTSVVIPDSVTEIGEDAFKGCAGLTSVVIPDNITALDKEALAVFVWAEEFSAPGIPLSAIPFKELKISAVNTFLAYPDRYTNSEVVESYRKYIFAQKKRLLPGMFSKDAVSGIAIYADAGKITPANVDEDFLIPAQNAGAHQCVAFLLDWKEKNVPKDYAERRMRRELTKDPYNVTDMKKLWRYRALPDGTLEISGYKGSAADVYVPERIGNKPVTAIKRKAFRSVETIVSVTIPSGVTAIGEEAFADCARLSSLVLPGSLTKIDEGAFFACERLTSVVIPEGVTIIGEDAFLECKGLTSVTISNGVTVIGVGAFADCPSLTSVVIPDSVTKIGWHAFSNCLDIRLMISDIRRLPREDGSRINAVLRFAKRGGTDFDEPYHSAYLKYIKSESSKMADLAMEHIELLSLMSAYKLIKAVDLPQYEKAAQKRGNTEAIALLRDYRNEHFGDLAKTDSSPVDDPRDRKRKLAIRERQEQIKDQKGISGLAFVVTGGLKRFGYWDEYKGFYNRDEIKAFIEQRGGYLRGAVSGKTDYLICNDLKSGSTKCKKAAELGIKIITEEEFLRMAEASDI